MKLFIIHPGIQHAPYLANGANRSKRFEQITLITSILFKPQQKVFWKFKKRIKPIDQEVKIINHYLYSVLYSLSKFLYNKIIINPHNQSHNNPIYFWQQIFGYLCLPRIYFNRKNLMVVSFETTGWPIVKYCKKWNIPVIMDFASISHEKAKKLGINETSYGIKLKKKERALIDYGFYCSKFCRDSFEGLTSAQREFVLYLGAAALSSPVSEVRSQKPINLNENNRPLNSIKLSFIANLEYRKGLDIFLEGVYAYQYPVILEVYLIGRIREEWVAAHLPKSVINQNVKLVYQSAMHQADLFEYLQQEDFDLNVQTSRFDSFAMVVPETMMQGIPNIVSPYVGAGEMIQDGIDGFIMGKLSSNNLNEILQKYIALDIQQRNELKKQVLNSAKNMVWENYYANLINTLSTILKNT